MAEFIVYLDHLFFFHSFISGHLGSFHGLAIVNSASVSMAVQVSFWVRFFLFPWAKYLEVELLDHIVVYPILKIFWHFLKFKDIPNIKFSLAVPVFYPGEAKAYVYTSNCVWLFIKALYIIIRPKVQTIKCTSVVYTQIVVYYSAYKGMNYWFTQHHGSYL